MTTVFFKLTGVSRANRSDRSPTGSLVFPTRPAETCVNMFVCLFCQKRRSTTKVRSSPGAKVRVTAKGKVAGSRATTQTVGVAKRAMAYRAKVPRSTVFLLFSSILLILIDHGWIFETLSADCQALCCKAASASSSRTCPTRTRRRRRATRQTLMTTRHQDPQTATTTTR